MWLGLNYFMLNYAERGDGERARDRESERNEGA